MVEGQSEFARAVEEVMSRNVTRGGPTSIRGIAREVARERLGGEPTHQQIEAERRALRRYMSGQRNPEEETIARIAGAAGAARSEFPKAVSAGELLDLYRQRVAELEADNRLLASRLERTRRRKETS